MNSTFVLINVNIQRSKSSSGPGPHYSHMTHTHTRKVKTTPASLPRLLYTTFSLFTSWRCLSRTMVVFFLLRVSHLVPPKMLPVPPGHVWHVQRLLPASVRGPVSGQRHLPGTAAQRGRRTHAPGGLDEAAQVSCGDGNDLA